MMIELMYKTSVVTLFSKVDDEDAARERRDTRRLFAPPPPRLVKLSDFFYLLLALALRQLFPARGELIVQIDVILVRSRAVRRAGVRQLFPTLGELIVQIDVIGVRSRAVRVRFRERPPLVVTHHRHGRQRARAHGDARDEQLRRRKRPRSSSIALAFGQLTAFDGVVRRHRRRRRMKTTPLGSIDRSFLNPGPGRSFSRRAD